MCGIIGYVGNKEATPILIEGLRRLEYRGYDSAGIAVIDKELSHQAVTNVVRTTGKLSSLEKKLLLLNNTPKGSVGMGHTRWATHGRPSDENAHPHQFGSVAVIHNGIIENHIKLKQDLSKEGHSFSSETDTEIIAHLIERELLKQTNRDLLTATRNALFLVEGAYAIVVLSSQAPDEIVCAKNASPLVIGFGDGENFLASDIPALLPHTRKVLFLEEGEVARLTRDKVSLYGLDGKERPIRTKEITWSHVVAEKEGYKHFMLKEIFEQPRAITDTLRGRILHEPHLQVYLDAIDFSKQDIQRVSLLACGTSYHAAMIAEYMIEQIAKIPVRKELASEYRYRQPHIQKNELVICVSQSGETADTLGAAKEAKERGAQILSVANVIESAIPRISHYAFYTHAGPEIGVASTKAFTTQLIALSLLAVQLGYTRKTISQAEVEAFLLELTSLPSKFTQALRISDKVKSLAKKYHHSQDMLFLGRGLQYPIALEGALKLKELSYIHAEGYAAGEMKHGPIALIEEGVPVVVLVPQDDLFEKTMSNLSEVKARGASVIAITNMQNPVLEGIADDIVYVPKTHPFLSPILTCLPLQLLAYYIADIKGLDVDQPRNLAKAVTVE